MRETIDLRVFETDADQYLGDDVGVRLGSTVRKLKLDSDDPLFEKIAGIKKELRQRGQTWATGWSIQRKYTPGETASAELFRMNFTRVFEPAGELTGTSYDESGACSRCGVGRRMVTDLSLDLRKVPKTADLARTIANEWIVSERFAGRLAESGFTGVELRPVRHRGLETPGSIDLNAVPSGRELVERGKAEGLSLADWRFTLWMFRPEQADLMRKIEAETAERHARRSRRPPPVTVYQLIITSRVEVAAPTRFGIDPFNEDDAGEYRCTPCDLMGLNILSELSVVRESWNGSDFAVTKQLVGARMGVLVPAPLIVVSPRVRELFIQHKLNGAEWEVAHLVP